jgi:hypothetical protein
MMLIDVETALIARVSFRLALGSGATDVDLFRPAWVRSPADRRSDPGDVSGHGVLGPDQSARAGHEVTP